MDQGRQAKGQGLRFALSEDGCKLLASYAPSADQPSFDGASLRKAIAAQGFDQRFVSDDSLAQLLQRCASADKPFTLEIGEVRNAVVTVEVEPDKMAAYLTVARTIGGTPVTAEQIRLALAERHVVFGLMDEAIAQVVAAGEAYRQLVAEGRKVVNGADGQLRSLIETVKERRPRLDEHDNADYRDFGGIATVSEGTRLMQQIPPTLGEDGKNILGEVVPAVPGKPVMFGAHLKGAEVDPTNPSFLIAKISGQPVLASNGMTVEPIVTFRTIDLATGNVNFEGSINITGDVRAGMVIRASGDIHVGGMVEAADLEAGGDLVVKGGIIGQGSVQENSASNESLARVRCGASCHAYFIENARVSAGDSIIVDRLVRQSELAAVNKIVVGKRGSDQGNIIGGLVAATLFVQAKAIGSPAGIKTRVKVGTNPHMQEKLAYATNEWQAKAKKLDEVVKLLAFIESHPTRVQPGIRQKAESTRALLLEESEQARQDMDTMTSALALAKDAKVVVEKTVFENVHVEIGSKVRVVEAQRSGGKFSLMAGKVVFV